MTAHSEHVTVSNALLYFILTTPENTESHVQRVCESQTEWKFPYCSVDKKIQTCVKIKKRISFIHGFLVVVDLNVALISCTVDIRILPGISGNSFNVSHSPSRYKCIGIKECDEQSVHFLAAQRAPPADFLKSAKSCPELKQTCRTKFEVH